MTYARHAIEADPGYAEAYSSVSAAYSLLGFFGFLSPAEAFPKARAAALKALEIDESLAEAHMVLACVQLDYDWDWPAVERACKRALELNPNLAWAHSFWSDWLFIMGRREEAMAEAQIAVELDPLSATLNFKLGQKLYWTRNYDHAIETITKALELDPSFVFSYIILAHVYAWKGMFKEGLATGEKVASLYSGALFSRALLALILAMAGKTDVARNALKELERHPKLDPLSLISLAEINSVIGEKTEAFALLEEAYQERVSMLIFLDALPNFENIRTDPRYADLLRRMRLPQLRFQTSRS